jgi:6-phosphogluconate dehydrogenase
VSSPTPGRVVAYARTPEKVQSVVKKGADGAHSLEELVSKLTPKRIIWLMIPAGKPVDQTIQKLITLLDKDDVIIDGGNSFYKDTLRRADELKQKNIHFVDAGTSGGKRIQSNFSALSSRHWLLLLIKGGAM